ncbi:MAG: phosphocholine cytidylyltransferase family protein [Xanthomonadales bacterium]|nr:phosphocholine cytidylyltransferase family protein [Xanthomonadales bacterium]
MSEVTDAIILAAGRGSRLGELSASSPKCLTVIAGKSILEWSALSLKQAGIENIHIVSGYQTEKVRAEAAALNINEVNNPDWQSTDMVYSLMLAVKHLKLEKFVVVYGDILFHPQHVINLIKSTNDIAMSYDCDWLNLWKLRFEQPMADAETFKIKNGKLCEIGMKPNALAEIQGQFMGLMLFRAEGVIKIKQLVEQIGKLNKKIQLTQLLQQLIQKKQPIEIIAVQGRWCEIDTETDLHAYNQKLNTRAEWSHDWRYPVISSDT